MTPSLLPFEHPWLLVLAFLSVVVLLRTRYFVRVSWGRAASGRDRTGFFKKTSIGLAIVLFAVAAAGPRWGEDVSVKKAIARKYVLVNDASGSMVDHAKPRGVGLFLSAVEAGNKHLLGMLSPGDMVGATVFADESYVVCHPTDDMKFVSERLGTVDYRVAPLNGGTRLDNALWGGLELLAEDARVLAPVKALMYGFGHEYKRTNALDRLPDVFRGCSVIVFTDGDFWAPEGRDNNVMSCYKLLNLYKELGVRAFLVSVETSQPIVCSYFDKTGGKAHLVGNSFSKKQFEDTYADIVKATPREYVVSSESVPKDYSHVFAVLGMVLLCVGVLLRTLFPSATEV